MPLRRPARTADEKKTENLATMAELPGLEELGEARYLCKLYRRKGQKLTIKEVGKLGGMRSTFNKERLGRNEDR